VRVAKLPSTNNEKKLRLRNQNQNTNQRKTKSSFSTVDCSKDHPLYKCRSVSFYRGGEQTFYIPRIPSCKTNQNRMCEAIFGKSPIGSSRDQRPVISCRKSRRLSCYHHVRLSGEDLESFREPPFAWYIPETQITTKLKCISR
jgi:hypothetical protein